MTSWQDAVALLVVALAVAYIGRRTWITFAGRRRSGSCGDCSGGDSCSERNPVDFVPLDRLEPLNNSTPKPNTVQLRTAMAWRNSLCGWG